jgi:hypothetical protein
MNEVDDRLTGDLVWELFPNRYGNQVRGSALARCGGWLGVAAAVALCWRLSPTLAVLIACAAMGAGDVRKGRWLARSIADKAGGTVCARFTYAWGTWKLAVAAFVLMFVTAYTIDARTHEVPPVFITSVLLCVGGWLLSAILTAWGLIRAYRSGMRVWVGEGVNRARMLLLGMLIAGFAVGVLGPMGIWLGASVPNARDSDDVVRVSVTVGTVLAVLFIGSFLMLLVLDRLSHHVVADHPGKFGPEVPAVGKM